MNVEHALELQQRAWLCHAEGWFDEAASNCRHALQLMEEVDGPDSLDVANLLNDLCEIEMDCQHREIARAVIARARAIEDRLGDSLNGDDAWRIRIRTLSLAGRLLRVRGEYLASEYELKTALETSLAAFGARSIEVVDARNNLAMLYKSCGRFDEGLRLYEQALETAREICGGDSLACATIYHNIGGILHARGDFAAAEAPSYRAWALSIALLGNDHPETIAHAAAHAAVLDGLERYEESERIYRRALSLFERAYGARHEEVASTLHNLAAVIAARGANEEAERCYRRALAIREQTFGTDGVETALTRNNLGRLLAATGRANEAISLLQTAVTALQARVAGDHPHLAAARANLVAATEQARQA